jgi:glycosyltransferase involved in cell wall biosynthesis
MNFTFSIITDGNTDNFISKIVVSIEEQEISNYEIIIVDNYTYIYL